MDVARLNKEGVTSSTLTITVVEKNMVTKSPAGFLASLFFSLPVLLSPMSATAQNKSFAYRTSSTPAFSSSLGASCVPAYVLLYKVANQGVFIVSAPTSELGKKMNLAPGMVLLTIDNYSMISTKVADNWLTHRSKRGPISFTYAVDNNGAARVQSGSVQDDTTIGSAAAAASTSSGSDPHAMKSISLTSGSAKPLLVSLINKSRAAGGLPPLREDGTLGNYAQSYAQYLANNASKYDVRDPNNNPHRDLNGRNQLERAQQANISNFLNETIGRNINGQGLLGIRVLHDQMMDSPSHRPSIMDAEAHLVGIGAAQSGNRLFVVEEFGR